ncbi:MAG: gamma-glutamyltransferase [Hyphomicrobiales bacterium]|nr:gamma-glutamyltransferase [Hyphomicrobiales bacterium]
MRSFHLPGRSPVIARNAMCATSHPLASLAAIETMRKGGNAVDAAITATALLCVVEPAMTGIGGDCFALIHKPGTGLVALNGSGRAPAAATPEWYARANITAIDVTTPHAVTVPGAIDAWDRLLKDHGTISLGEALGPAIEAARGGFAIAPRVGADWAGAEPKIKLNEGARRHLLKDGRTPAAGEVMRSPALARSLEIIARQGRDAFYKGELAQDMVANLKELGGLHTLSDFASQSSSYVTPISVTYRGAELFELPPNNQGIVALMVLKILDRLGTPAPDPSSSERYHLLMEAARLAYAARDMFLADPNMADVPVTHMLSDRLADDLARRIDPRRRSEIGAIPEPTGSDTIYLTVVDKNGMAVSFINSLFAAFGSGIVTKETGIALHNRGAGFVLTPGHRNCIAPGKRPLHTLVPAMAMRNGKPWLSFGVMGAMFQPVGHVYVLTNMLDYDMDAQEALDHPRVFIEGEQLLAERGVATATFDRLAALGHSMGWREEPWGGGQIVEMDPERGVLIGASDPRKDGLALGY